MRILSKKGFGLDKLVISLVVTGFILVVGLALMGKARDTQTSGSAEYNASKVVVDAIDDIPAWLPIIVLAFIAVIVLGVVYMLRRN